MFYSSDHQNSILKHLDSLSTGLQHALEDSYRQSSKEKKEHIDQLISEFKLPSSVTLSLFDTIESIEIFEKSIKPNTRTPRERFEHLNHIQSLAHELFFELTSMEPDDAMRIYLLEREVLKQESHDGITLSRVHVLNLAVGKFLAEQNHDGWKGGRPNVRARYAHQIARLAELAALVGIEANRGKRFREFCDAVFSLAGVRATAEGAIRQFLKTKSKE